MEPWECVCVCVCVCVEGAEGGAGGQTHLNEAMGVWGTTHQNEAMGV